MPSSMRASMVPLGNGSRRKRRTSRRQTRRSRRRARKASSKTIEVPGTAATPPTCGPGNGLMSDGPFCGRGRKPWNRPTAATPACSPANRSAASSGCRGRRAPKCRRGPDDGIMRQLPAFAPAGTSSCRRRCRDQRCRESHRAASPPFRAAAASVGDPRCVRQRLGADGKRRAGHRPGAERRTKPRGQAPARRARNQAASRPIRRTCRRSAARRRCRTTRRPQGSRPAARHP